MADSAHGRLRVLQVIQDLTYGGMERVLADLVVHLDPGEFDLHVLGLAPLGRFVEILEGCGTVHEPPAMSRWSMLRPAALRARIASVAPHVVHSHGGVWYKTARAARMAGVPAVVHTEHGIQDPRRRVARWLHRAAARRSDVVVAVSEDLRRNLERRLDGAFRELILIRNGIDLAKFRREIDRTEARRRFGIPAGARVVGSVGRLEPVKAYDRLLRALASLPGVHLALAGDGSDRPALEGLARELGIDGRTTFVGWTDEVVPFHRAIDVFAMTSTTEGTSISLLEAMASGLPPVVTDVGGNAEVLGPRLGDGLVPEANPDALLEALRALLDDDARRARASAAARARIEEQFDLARAVDAHARLYRRVAGRRESARAPRASAR